MRLSVHRYYPGPMVDDDQMRRRGFRVLRVGSWRVLWCKHPEEWRF